MTSVCILGGARGVFVNRSISSISLTPPKKPEGTWVFDGTKTASLCQIWPEKLISLLQVSKKESKLNFWICFFLGISKICCFEMVCHWYNVDFFRQMLFSETQKFSSWCDMNFPRCSGSRSRSVVPGSCCLDTNGVFNDSIRTLRDAEACKKLWRKPTRNCICCVLQLQTTQLVEPPTDLVIYSYKARDMFQRNKSRSKMTRSDTTSICTRTVTVTFIYFEIT